MHTDCREGMASIDANSVDTIITDPPYGLAFMGKAWDSPGGTGDFPMRRSGPINTVNTGASRQGGRQRACADWQARQARDMRLFEDWNKSWASAALRVAKPGAMMLVFGGTRTHHRLICGIEDAGWEIRDCLMWLQGQGFPKSHNLGNGYGTALKPAWEPIIMAMKPTEGTFAANAERWGVAGLNVDGARVPHDEECRLLPDQHGNQPGKFYKQGGRNKETLELKPAGRWPANLVLDEDAARMLDEQSGESVTKRVDNPSDCGGNTWGGTFQTNRGPRGHSDSGGASRFFYTAKASNTDRGHAPAMPLFGEPEVRNTHPTVKPTSVMEWLVLLTKTPTGGVVLDPFMGSGTTGVACRKLGRDFIGIEREAEYIEIARQRLGVAA